MHKYEKGSVIGSGTYSTVYRATVRDTGEAVALKKLRQVAVSGQAFGPEGCGRPGPPVGVSQVALREIKALQELRHENVLRLREVFPHKRTLVLVFDFCDGGDLEQLIRQHAAGVPGALTAGAGHRDMGEAHRQVAHSGPSPGFGAMPAGCIKSCLQMLLRALAHCHEQVRTLGVACRAVRLQWGVARVTVARKQAPPGV
jgi:serine/threonine protein kinase